MSAKRDLFITATAAFATGFITAVLVTPQSGRSMRQRIAQRALSQSRWLEHRLHDIERQLVSIEHQVVHTGAELGDRVREATHQALSHYLPQVPDEDQDWEVRNRDLQRDLRRMPRS